VHRFYPADIIALAGIISTSVLIGLGNNGTLEYILPSIIAAYLGGSGFNLWRKK
jgi:hypothetical protein